MNRYSKVVMLGVQKREYSILKEIILKKFLRPDLLLILGKSTKQFFIERGMQALLLPPAVDQGKFFAVSEEEKIKIRLEYNIPADKTVVLHVGHIKVGRNIENLIEVQKTNNMQVVIVGSTSIVIEHRIKEKLIKEGIRIIDQVVHDISKIYKMSDMYVFPVLNNKEAIDMPLSVLEAMSCNLPVITTRYGGLVDYFEEDGCLKYFSGNDELVALVKSMEHSKSNNAKKMEQFTWSSFTDAVISACENII